MIQGDFVEMLRQDAAETADRVCFHHLPHPVALHCRQLLSTAISQVCAFHSPFRAVGERKGDFSPIIRTTRLHVTDAM
jgi:hypothetical protein